MKDMGMMLFLDAVKRKIREETETNRPRNIINIDAECEEKCLVSESLRETTTSGAICDF